MINLIDDRRRIDYCAHDHRVRRPAAGTSTIVAGTSATDGDHHGGGHYHHEDVHRGGLETTLTAAGTTPAGDGRCGGYLGYNEGVRHSRGALPLQEMTTVGERRHGGGRRK